MNAISTLPQNSIVFHHGQLRTTSLKVAEAFGKQHKDVIRKLIGLDCSKEFNERNYAPVDYTDAKGEKRPAWEMTKDGFMFLVMGFTGKKAAQVKEAYINAFNQMYERLFGKAQHNLTPQQQRHIQTRVAELAHQPGNSFAAVYASIKNKFEVGSYKDVPATQYPELCDFLHCEPLQGELLGPETKPDLNDSPIELDDDDLQALHILLIHFNRLARYRIKLLEVSRLLESDALLKVGSSIQEGTPQFLRLNQRYGEKLAKLHSERLARHPIQY